MTSFIFQCGNLIRLAPLLIFALTSVATAKELAIEEIFVVAQKRSQSLQKVPVSVTAISSQEIEYAGVQDIFDLAEQIPALDIFQNAGPINTSFRIRRIGNEANIPNFEPAVGLFVDGAFRARSGVGVGDLFDIERVEVLRGPQTSLYGKNTTAGLVSIITKRPTDTFEAFGELSAGQFYGADTADMIGVKMTVNGPVATNLSGRLSGSLLNHDHTMVNLFGGDDSQSMDRYSLRGQLLYAPASELKARLILGRFVINSANAGEFEIHEGVSIATVNSSFGVPCPASTSLDRAFCNNRAAVVELQANDATLNISYPLASYEVTSTTAYEEYDTLRDFDADQLNIEVLDIIDRQDSASFSQELRISSPIGRSWTWMSGVYYYSNDFRRGDPVFPTAILGADAPLFELMPGFPAGQPGDAGILISESKTQHFSAFGNTEFRINEKFALTASARWQTEDKQSKIVNSANHTTPTLITVGLAPPSASAMLSRNTDGFTWNISGQYQWTDNVMTYVSASRGFKSGGFNAGFGNSPAGNREFGDERVLSFEAGLKTMLWQRRLQFNTTIFTSKYDDYQSAGFVGLRFLVNNAEQVDVSGVELDLHALLNERLVAAIAVSYVDAEYGRYTGGACYFGRVPDNADNSACVLSGSTLPLAPRWKSSSHLGYEHTFDLGDFYARAEWLWTDKYHTNATLDPRHIQSSYSLVNLRIGLRIDNYDVSLWLNNAGNETFVMQDGPTNLFPRDPAFGRFLGAPRSFGLTLRAQW